jgi:hypothetical protein
MVRALKAGDFHSPESSPNPWIIDKSAVSYNSWSLSAYFLDYR